MSLKKNNARQGIDLFENIHFRNLVAGIFFGILFLNITGLFAQGTAPFLEIRPYAVPPNEQYPVHAQVDHLYPTQSPNGEFIRMDGFTTPSQSPPASNCLDGTTCYDGHAGVDYWMAPGIPLLAAASGTIVWAEFGAGVNPCPNGLPPNGDLGVVIIDHGNSYYSTYLHLNPPMVVTVGQNVVAGDTVGFNGDTGCASTPHLHFEMRKDTYFFNQQQSWAVNSYGWWGTTQDPIRDMRGNSSVWLWKSAPLIDDGDNGFERFHGPDWERLNGGYNNDSWQTPSVNSLAQSRHYAVWVPELPQPGEYHVQVYVPDAPNAVDKAIYEIYVKQPGGVNSKDVFIVDQTAAPNEFQTIATMNFSAGANCMVLLRDVVDAGSQGSRVLFDAVRFVNTTTGINDRSEQKRDLTPLKLVSNHPNPFQNSIAAKNASITFQLEKPMAVSVSINNVLGQKVFKYNPGVLASGQHTINWAGRDEQNRPLTAGVYIFHIKADNVVKTGKFLIIN